MSGRPVDSTADHDEVPSAACAFTEENAAGYALGALDRFDRSLIEHHLRWCSRCREIVQAAENVTAYLPFLSPAVAPPSPDVRTRLMERIASDLTGPIIEVPPVSSRLARAADTKDSGPAPVPLQRRWTRFLPAALVAPLAIALIVVLAWANNLQDTIDEQEIALANQQQLNRAIANGGEVQLYSMEPRCSECKGGSRLGIDKEDGVGMVVAWDLDPKQKHSVWGVNDKGDKEWVSTLEVDPDGAAIQAFGFPGDASSYTEVFISSGNGSVAYLTNIATPPADIPQDDSASPSASPDPGS